MRVGKLYRAKLDVYEVIGELRFRKGDIFMLVEVFPLDESLTETVFAYIAKDGERHEISCADDEFDDMFELATKRPQ